MANFISCCLSTKEHETKKGKDAKRKKATFQKKRRKKVKERKRRDCDAA